MNDITRQQVNEIQNIYKPLVAKYGNDTKAAMYDRLPVERYMELAKIDTLKDKSILEIGCGLGGMYSYLHENNLIDKNKYLGIDIVQEMVDLASKQYPEARFKHLNIHENMLSEQFDYVLMSGMFNNNIDNPNDYIRSVIEKAFEYCNLGIGFNFISDYVNFKTNEMCYFHPEDILNFCINNLSRKVNIYHHYTRCDVCVFVYK